MRRIWLIPLLLLMDHASSELMIKMIPDDEPVHREPLQSVRLMCATNADLSRCVWKHQVKRSSNTYEIKQICELYERSSKFVKGYCKVANHTDRFHVVGDYKKHQCAVKLDDLRVEDSGQWICEVEKYRNHFDRLWKDKESATASVYLNVSKPGSSSL